MAGFSKNYFVGELDWTGQKGGDSLPSFYSLLESMPGSGSMIWSVFGHDDQCCNYVVHVRPLALLPLSEDVAHENCRTMVTRSSIQMGITELFRLRSSSSSKYVPLLSPLAHLLTHSKSTGVDSPANPLRTLCQPSPVLNQNWSTRIISSGMRIEGREGEDVERRRVLLLRPTWGRLNLSLVLNYL